MNTISLCMIVKNEEDVLARCLTSVQEACDEIIIVDTGSTDSTKSIALQFTDKVFDFPWIDDFSAARNFSLEHADMDYILWLDADDVLMPEDLSKLLALKKTLDPMTDIVMMPYHISFDAAGRPVFSYERERLIKNHRGYRFEGAVHEAIVPTGNIAHESAAVTHQKTRPGDPDRNLRIFEKQIREGKTLEPRHQYYYARELYYHNRFEEAAKTFEDFLDSGLGWVENNLNACQDLANCCYALGERQRAVMALLRSFTFAPPRAELCCDLARHLMEDRNLKAAIYWYNQALSCNKEDVQGGFVRDDCYGYIPYMQLCVCYDRLGDHETASEYNEKAASIKPEDDSVLHNREYFKQLGIFGENLGEPSRES